MKLFLFINVFIFSCSQLFAYHTTVTDQIQQIINQQNQWHIGCTIYSHKENRIVYEHNARQLFTPASNTKLFTGALALKTWGTDYVFKTELVTDGNNIYLKASGDPSLTSADIEAMIAQLAGQCIDYIGDFCIDDYVFDAEIFGPGSFIDNIGYPWNAPVLGLTIDHKPAVIEPVDPTIFLNAEQNAKLPEIFFNVRPLIESLLAKYNIQWSGVIRYARSDFLTAFVEHQSEPFATLLNHMMKESDNLYADCFFKKVAAVLYETAGTWQKGNDAMMNFVQTSLLINSDEIVIKDGSGRSRYNLIAPEHIIKLLTFVYQQPYAATFFDSLAVSGLEGTLSKRMNDMPGKVKAKTGLLAGVSALSGYIETDDDLLLFSILTNGFIAKTLYAPECRPLVEDAICRLLAQ